MNQSTDHSNEESKKVVVLTPREYEILTYIAMGFTSEEIAAKLYISPGTVKTYTVTLYAKMGLTNSGRDNRVQLVLIAISAGVVPSPSLPYTIKQVNFSSNPSYAPVSNI